MVDLLVNGDDRGPLAGWVIALVHGQTLIGRLVIGRVARDERTGDSGLDPVYGLTCVMQTVQQSPRHAPQLVTLRQVLPLLTFPTLRRIVLPEGAVLIPIEHLSTRERRNLAQSVDQCERLMSSMRAEEAGVVLAPAGAKLP